MTKKLTETAKTAKILSMNDIINMILMYKMPPEMALEIAKRERARRKEHKMSRRVLTEKSGVTESSIKRFEATGEISFVSLIKLAYALDCKNDIERLFAEKYYASIQDVIDEE